MKVRRVVLAVCLIGCLVVPVSSQDRKDQPDHLKSLVTGTVIAVPAADLKGPAQPQQAGVPALFTGVLNVTNFVVQNGVLMAVGTLSGTVTDAEGNIIQTVQDLPVALQVTGMTAFCPILFLQLGPLDLNVLGLLVHLNQVVLNITAQPGAGNLLGNLLCAVAHLLDEGALAGLLGNIAALLNQILAALPAA